MLILLLLSCLIFVNSSFHEDKITDRYDTVYCKSIYSTQKPTDDIKIMAKDTIFSSLCASQINIFNTTSTFKSDNLQASKYDACITDIEFDVNVDCPVIQGIILFKNKDRFIRLSPGRYWKNTQEFLSVSEYYNIYKKYNELVVIIDNDCYNDAINSLYKLIYMDLYSITIYRIINGNVYVVDNLNNKFHSIYTSHEALLYNNAINIIYTTSSSSHHYTNIIINPYNNINNHIYDYKYKYSRQTGKIIKNMPYIWDIQMIPIDIYAHELFIKHGNKINLFGLYFKSINCEKNNTINETINIEQYDNTTIYDIPTIPDVNETILFSPIYNVTSICCQETANVLDIIIYIISGTVILTLVVIISIITALVSIKTASSKKEKPLTFKI